MRRPLSFTAGLAVFELLLAAILWGFGFIATRWSLDALNATEITFARFALAVLVGFPFLCSREARAEARSLLRLSFVPGVLLFAMLMFQTWGMNYTTATKSGFITTLYVVFVPLTEAMLSRRRLPPALWLCVLTALLGTTLITGVHWADVNVGDLLTLVCALLATAQILALAQRSPQVKNAFAFNIYQVLWATLLCLPFVHWPLFAAKLTDSPHWPAHSWFGIVSLSLGSTVIAFFLQVRAQRRLPPTVSSLLFLLESPFAWIFAMIWLNESFRGTEGLGATLIFVSALGATWVEAKRGKT